MKYKLASGEVVEAPEDLTPEESAWLQQQGGKPAVGKLEDVGKSGLSGVVEGAIRAPFIGGDIASLGATLINKIRPGTFSKKAEESQSNQVLQAISDLPGNIAYSGKEALKSPQTVTTPELAMLPGMGLARLGVKALQGKMAGDHSSAEPLSLYTPQTQAGRYANSMGNAAGGLVLGGTGAFKNAISLKAPQGAVETAKALAKKIATNPVTQAAGVGAAGEFAGDVARGFDETKEQNPLARFAGSTAAATAMALGSFLNKRTAARPLHEVFKDTDAPTFNQARAETSRLRAAGTTQNTVGDSFANSNPQVGAMEREVSNEMGGGQLAQKLTGRVSGDIPTLEARSNAAINNAVVPNAAPNSGRFPTAQEDLLQQARSARTQAVRGAEEGSDLVPTGDVASIIRALRNRAQTPGNRRTLDADFANQTARTLAGGYRYDMPQAATPTAPGRMSGPTPVTPLGSQGSQTSENVIGVPAIGGPLALPGPGSRAVAPTAAPQTGALGPVILNPAEFGMGPKPMSDFQMPSTPDITTIESRAPRPPQGFNLVELSKRLNAMNTAAPKGAAAADNASVLDKNVTVARGQALDLARRELAARNPHYAQGQQIYQDMSPGVDALKTLVEHPTVLQASTSMRPNPVREGLISHLSKIDPNLAASTSERMRAADILSRNTAQHGKQGLQNELGQTGVASAASPWYAAYKALSTAGRRSANEDISRLLANPTQQNMAILEDLARNNPDLARSLVRQGLIGAVGATTHKRPGADHEF